MSVEAIQSKLTELLGSGAGLDGSLKMNFGDDGFVRIEGTEVTTDDTDADATISISLEDAVAMMEGDLNPTMAFMQGKLSVDGNMGMAMKLSNLLDD
ncbi:SCP2 sterol-binding domain-containing protein [Alphaproteobacteria bacterium]|jgi:putative sterol carrier protein|nr:SCP2 sterol-binding domain-containing protein [Alphaproteobacteria bacterium]|tara:strand:+ start:191 stop:481 length:291 start_codon:yes stop_codon:yes gene_type:complete